MRNNILLAICHETSELFSQGLQANIVITDMNERALEKWQTWKTIEGTKQRKKPNGGWNWAELRRKYYHKLFSYSPQRRIDLAIWCDDQLSGLVLGQVSKSKEYVTIDYIESLPVETHRLKGHILDIALFTTEQYATILNIRELRLIDPVENLIPYYQAEGFELVTAEKKPYCFRKIS